MSRTERDELERDLEAARAQVGELHAMLSEVAADNYDGVSCGCQPASRDEDGNALPAVQCRPCRVRALLARTGEAAYEAQKGAR